MIEALEPRTLLSTYYVSTSGSDNNAGTSAAPWKTLQHAANVTKAGDTVDVAAGTYKAGVNFYGLKGGTATAPITFSGAPGAIVTHCATSGVNASLACFNVENTSYYVIQGFDIQSDGSAQRAGIRTANSNGDQILNNTVNKAYIGIFTSIGTNLLIQGNTCSNSTDQHGIYMSDGESGCVIKGNTLFGNNWDGLHMNALNGYANTGAIVEDNVIYGNNEAGMDIEGATNGVYENNLIYNNNKEGITLHHADQANTPACSGNVFENNTITGNAMSAIQMQTGDASEIIFNNILLSSSNIYGSIATNGTPTGLFCDYNVVQNFSENLGTSKLTLAQWQSATGQDKHSFVATPSQLFVAGAYALKSGSPAIDKGASEFDGYLAPTTDILGKARPDGSGFDIGAYEY